MNPTSSAAPGSRPGAGVAKNSPKQTVRRGPDPLSMQLRKSAWLLEPVHARIFNQAARALDQVLGGGTCPPRCKVPDLAALHAAAVAEAQQRQGPGGFCLVYLGRRYRATRHKNGVVSLYSASRLPLDLGLSLNLKVSP